MPRLTDHYFRYQVHQPEQTLSGRAIILKVNLTGVHSIVTDDPNYIQCLLNANI